MLRSVLPSTAVALYEPFLGRLLQGLRREVCAMLPYVSSCLVEPKRPSVLLDCCCGAGGFLRMAHETHGNTWQFMGLDSSQAMIHEAQQRVPQALCVQGDGVHLPFATQSIDVATVCMAVHTMPAAQGAALVQELLRVARFVIVADYALAERNIHVPSAYLAHAVEALVGGEHYACYKKFMQGGALEGFLYTQGLSPLKRASCLGGAGLVSLLQGHKE